MQPNRKSKMNIKLSTKAAAVPMQHARDRQQAPLITPTDLKSIATKDVSAAMNGILADVFALYLKQKTFIGI